MFIQEEQRTHFAMCILLFCLHFRWAELKECIQYHIQMAALLNATSTFRVSIFYTIPRKKLYH